MHHASRISTTLLVTLVAVLPTTLCAQDSTTVQGAVFNRPFITSAAGTSIGGYLEANSNYFVEDGITDGFSMEMRRFNVFLYSAISRRVKFLSELEFEHGTEEIALETALLDIQLDPKFIIRGGILLVPLGALNQNHDSPRWDFVERPLVSSDIIPSTLSEVGFGFYGRAYKHPVTISYDMYLTNGLGDGVVSNAEERTFLPAAANDGAPSLQERRRPQPAGDCRREDARNS